MSILIKNVLIDGKSTDIFIENNIISVIGKRHSADAETIIDGRMKAAIPGLINTHTHAAMTLLRSYADDMELHNWLQNRIWPAEAELTEKDIYAGTKLACLEMIKTGTTCFNDQYFMIGAAGKAVKETGMRAFLSEVYLDVFDGEDTDKLEEKTRKAIDTVDELDCNRIRLSLGPHALYTNSREKLEWIARFAQENNMLIHFHLAETKKEVSDCVRKYSMKPVEYLEEINFLYPGLICAHSVWLDEKDIMALAKHDVKISHNPVSNMKLSVGSALPYELMRKHRLTISLGTDGTASNNSLDMFDTMKFAALLQKHHTNMQTTMPAREVFRMATLGGAETLGIRAGEIKEGSLADIALIDLKKPEMRPGHNLVSDLVYSANGSCVDTVIIDGKLVMENRKVEGEEDILDKATEAGLALVSKSRKD